VLKESTHQNGAMAPGGIMHDRPPNDSGTEGRRAFLTKLAAGAAAGAAGLSFASMIDPTDAWAQARANGAPDGEHWLDGLKGQHRQLVDAYMPNETFPFAFVFSFLAVQPPPAQVGTVMVLRHFAMPFALNDAMWAKYKIGENLKFMDSTTKAFAVRNVMYKPKPGSLPIEDMAIDKLMAKGTIFGACNIALQFLSAEFAPSAKVTKEAAAKEWAANLVPGIPLIPSGTWGVNRAQEKNCTYCSGGG
jgi:hypothetical protein